MDIVKLLQHHSIFNHGPYYFATKVENGKCYAFDWGWDGHDEIGIWQPVVFNPPRFVAAKEKR